MGVIAKNYEKLRRSVDGNVFILVATKNRSIVEIKEVIEAGAVIIGENRIEDLVDKRKKLECMKIPTYRVEWHVIGPLQSKKVKSDYIKYVDCVQTLAREKIARKLNAVCEGRKDRLPVLIQINIGEEETKHGLSPNEEEIFEFIRSLRKYKNLLVRGLMTLEPLIKNEAELRKYMKRMHELYEAVKREFSNESYTDIKILSMGTTQTYKIAIEEGSNMIRIGTAIFGHRI
jgi:hypothetical protein